LVGQVLGQAGASSRFAACFVRNFRPERALLLMPAAAAAPDGPTRGAALTIILQPLRNHPVSVFTEFDRQLFRKTLAGANFRRLALLRPVTPPKPVLAPHPTDQVFSDLKVEGRCLKVGLIKRPCGKSAGNARQAREDAVTAAALGLS